MWEPGVTLLPSDSGPTGTDVAEQRTTSRRGGTGRGLVELEKGQVQGLLVKRWDDRMDLPDVPARALDCHVFRLRDYALDLLLPRLGGDGPSRVA